MAGEAHLGISFGVDDGVAGTTGLIVDAAGPMAAFAAYVHGIGAMSHEARVSGAGKVFVHIRMALRAGFRTYKFRAGNIWWHKHGAIDSDARDQHPG